MATPSYYFKGSLVQISGSFYNGPNLADPSAVYCQVKDPLGNTTLYTYLVDPVLTRDGVGLYHVDVSADTSGTWYYRFWSPSFKSASENKFDVIPSQF